jgi:hypothetical protein
MYNYTQQNYCIFNKGLHEDWNKEENVEVIEAATIHCLKKYCKKFCPMLRIRPVTARPAPQ